MGLAFCSFRVGALDLAYLLWCCCLFAGLWVWAFVAAVRGWCFDMVGFDCFGGWVIVAVVVLRLSLLWVVVVFSVCCFVEFAFVRRFWFGCFAVNCGF